MDGATDLGAASDLGQRGSLKRSMRKPGGVSIMGGGNPAAPYAKPMAMMGLRRKAPSANVMAAATHPGPLMTNPLTDIINPGRKQMSGQTQTVVSPPVSVTVPPTVQTIQTAPSKLGAITPPSVVGSISTPEGSFGLEEGKVWNREADGKYHEYIVQYGPVTATMGAKQKPPTYAATGRIASDSLDAARMIGGDVLKKQLEISQSEKEISNYPRNKFHGYRSPNPAPSPAPIVYGPHPTTGGGPYQVPGNSGLVYYLESGNPASTKILQSGPRETGMISLSTSKYGGA